MWHILETSLLSKIITDTWREIFNLWSICHWKTDKKFIRKKFIAENYNFCNDSLWIIPKSLRYKPKGNVIIKSKSSQILNLSKMYAIVIELKIVVIKVDQSDYEVFSIKDLRGTHHPPPQMQSIHTDNNLLIICYR